MKDDKGKIIPGRIKPGSENIVTPIIDPSLSADVYSKLNTYFRDIIEGKMGDKGAYANFVKNNLLLDTDPIDRSVKIDVNSPEAVSFAADQLIKQWMYDFVQTTGYRQPVVGSAGLKGDKPVAFTKSIIRPARTGSFREGF